MRETQERINKLDIKRIHRKTEYDILIVDDDGYTIKLLTDIFETKGYKCEKASSGKEALELLENSMPKLILLDIILPDINGYEILKRIRVDKKLRDIPVFFLTAIAGSDVQKNLEETKADGYILKPFNFSDFEIIFDILNNKRKEDK